MSAAGDLIAQLASEGTLDSRGEFTLDREKARDKMRKFQLEDPRRYVLELVQAAVLRGATAIRFEIDADDMRMWFDGRAFTVDDFDRLYGSLLSDGGDSPGLSQLALGVNAAMGLGPKHILVESGEARLTVTDAEDDFGPLGEPRPDTFIHVRQRFSAQVLLRWAKKIRGKLPEIALLQKHCLHAPIPIEPLDVLGSTLVDPILSIDLEWGTAAVVDGWHEDKLQARLLSNGVWLTTVRLKPAAIGFVALADASGLKKDLSQSEFIQDEAYKLFLRAVTRSQPALLDPLVRELTDDADARSRVRSAALNLMAAMPKKVPFAGDALAEFEICRDTQAQPVTLAWLDSQRANKTPIVFSRFPSREGNLPEHPRVVHAVTAQVSRALTKRFNAIDVTDRLALAARVELNRRAWLSRKREPFLPATGFYVHRPFSAEGFRGEVGVSARSRERSSFSFIVQGCLLAVVEVELFVVGLVAVVEADLQPNATFDDVVRDETLARVLHVMGLELPALFDQLAAMSTRSDWKAACLVSFVDDALADGSHERMLDAFGFSSEHRAAYARPLPWTIADGPSIRSHPMFETVAGVWLSIDDVVAVAQRDGEVLTAELVTNDMPNGATIIRSSPAAVSILRAIAGEAKVVDWDNSSARARALFLAKPIERAVLKLPLDLSTGFVEGDIRGQIGFDVRTPNTVLSSVRLLKQSRFLGDAALVLPGGGFEVVAACDALNPTEQWQDVVRDETLARLPGVLARGAIKLACALVPVVNSGLRPEAQVLLLNMAAAGFPRADLRHAYDGGQSEVDRREQLNRHYTHAGVCTDPESFLGDLYELGPDEPMHKRILSLKSPLRDARIFRGLAGARHCFGDAFEGYARDGKLYVTNQPADQDLAEGRLILHVSSTERAVLTAILGDGVEVCDEWLETQRIRRNFLTRPQRTSLQLDDEVCLVRVPVDAEGFEGEVALVRPHPGSLHLSSVQICKLHRDVRVHEYESSANLKAIVNHSGSGLHSQVTTVVREVVDGCLPRLAKALDTHWGELGADDRWAHAVDLMLAAPSLYTTDIKRLTARPGFETVDGQRRSLDDMGQIGRTEQLYFVFDGPVDLGRVRPDCVIRLRYVAEPTLLARVASVSDAAALAKVAQPYVVWRGLATPLPNVETSQVLAERSVSQHGLTGSLYIPEARRDPRTSVRFGVEGREICRRPMMLPAAGVVRVPEAIVADDWRSVTLTEEQVAYLDGLVVKLALDLVAVFERTGPGPRRESIRHWLGEILVAVKKRRADEVQGDLRRLLARLENLRLFELDNGRHIDAATAIAERPHDLNRVGLWHSRAAQVEDVVETLEKSGPFEPAEIDPEAAFVAAVIEELHLVRRGNEALLSDVNLDGLRVGDGAGSLVVSDMVLHRKHPLIRVALARFAVEPAWVTFVASAVYTALNVELEAITDAHEAEFHVELVRLAASVS